MPIAIAGRSIDLKKAVGSGKTKLRSQMCTLVTEYGILREVEIPVKRYCIEQEEWASSWLIDPDNQFMDEETGLLHQLIGERSANPIALLTGPRVRDLTQRMTEIFDESWSLALSEEEIKNAETRVRGWLMIMLGVPLILSILIIGMIAINRMTK